MHAEYEKLTILYQIGLGLTDVDFIASRISQEKEKVRQIVNRLLREGKINTQNGLSLSRNGLLELSRQMANQESKRGEYAFCSSTGLPYFPYKNRFQRNVIFHPGLFFDPARRLIDNERNVVYKTSIPIKGFNLEDLEIFYNLLYEYEYLHPTGFWLIKCERKEFCGWGFSNLTDTLELAERPLHLEFCCGFTDFIFLIRSDLDKSGLCRPRIIIYITKDRFPYLDTLDSIYERLEVFMNFHGIQELPRGKELKLKHTKEWKGLPEPRLQFVPQVLGKILRRNTDRSFSVPYVVVMTPYRARTRLKQVSPWFVTCPGGCLEQELAARKTHYVHLLQVVSLPEIDIVTLMMNT